MMNNRSQPSPYRRAPSVRIAFRTLGRTLRHGYDNLGTLALTGLFWYIGALLVLPIGVVTAAIHRVVQPMTEERASDWRKFFDHMRGDLGWSTKLMLVLVVVPLVMQINIQFYSAADLPAVQIVGFFFTILLVVWFGVMLFAFPMALRQQTQQLGMTLRNTVVMVFANLPGVFLSLVLLALLVALLFIIPPLFMLIPGVVTLWGQENIRLLLVASGYLPEDEIADRPRVRG